MSTALTVSGGAPGLALPAADAERARSYANAEKAAATRRAYGTDFLIFRTWCEERQVEVLPASPATVAAFLAHEASPNVKASTISHRTAAIRYAHKLAGFATPTDDELVKTCAVSVALWERPRPRKPRPPRVIAPSLAYVAVVLPRADIRKTDWLQSP
jgi:hypothetical protein